MTKDNHIVHCVWVGSALSLLEKLTIKLLLSHGHEVHLWSYAVIENTPEGVVNRDAGDILPSSSMFRYDGEPLDCLPNGGKGSLSHWSDQFQLKLLDKYGGIYTQMDVSHLTPLCFKNSVAMPVWKGEDTCVAPYIMKCPAGEGFTKRAYEKTSKVIHKDTLWNGIDWNISMRLMGEALEQTYGNIEECSIDLSTAWDLGCRDNGPFFEDMEIPDDITTIHWSNATVNKRKDDPIVGSTYWRLLKKMKLIAD